MEINEYEKKQNNNNENKKQHHFQVKNTPNGFFDLFNKVSDTYIYEKKFCCDLPQNIIPPKSLHYPLCLENLCKTDLLTMNFDLKNYGEILTDPKLNTLIHEDFINNALEIVFPNLTKFSEKKTEKDVEFKNDILNIIERNDEILEEKPKILLEKPYYLRSSTFFRPSLSNFNDYEKKKSNKNINKENKKNEINIVKYIENSFKLIENIKEGFVHPKNNKKVVKKVYDILPMVDYLPFKINQYMFPNDPIKELELNKKIEIPKTFIIKKKNNSNNNNEHNNNFYNNNENEYELEDFSLYKNEKAKDQILDENKNYATYYSHEKDYSLIKSHDYENFNRYLLFKDNKKNTIGVLLTNDKITLKRQNFSKNKNYDGNEDENMNFLNQKRERDLIIMPKNLEEETINKIKKYYKNIGMEYKLDIKNIDDIDFSQIEGVKNIKNEEEEEKNNLNNYDYNNNKENDLNEDYENNENDNNNSLDNENYNSENKIDDEIDEAHTPNANENEEEEDALFEDDGNNNNNDNNDYNNENNIENENDDNNENKNEDEIEKKNKNIINDE